ncbi:MAG: SGNH/GDSL hydrolase family protein [Anaerolineaceae bacterium]|nr:SGNH/GDSL hydrolase family protein [Anaerolineaceae bacterium]
MPKYWSEWPLIPLVSTRAKEIYRIGQEMGNDPHSFSTIGDCQSVPSVFMGIYDTDEYTLGEGYADLEETIKQFRGSFKRDSISVKDGMSVASALSPMWADSKQCLANETPLECELRINKPVIMFINLGTNWRGGDEVTHEKYMRQIVDILIDHGVIPILSSKGDNLEGGHRINQSIARVTYDYDIPFWNFWRSIRGLPGKGIDGSREGGYLTPEAWGRRSFTGLMALDAVWREINK